MVVEFLAPGFEESEAIIPVDVLRRAGQNVMTVGLEGKEVTGSHGLTLIADETADGFVLPKRAEMVLLPGGMPGTRNLDASEKVAEILAEAEKRGIFVGAICAAPLVLGNKGLLKGQKATIFPGMENELPEGVYTAEPVVDSGRIITGRSGGVAFEYAFLLVEKLMGRERALQVKETLHTVW